MSHLVVCLSGRIGSGKSSVSAALASSRGAAYASFGSYVRTAAIAKGLDAERREVLQELGSQLIEDHGYAWLCQEVIKAANRRADQDLVIDGIRHVEAFDAIKALVAPAKAVLLHLRLEYESEVLARDSERGVTPGQRAVVERHATERDVQFALPARADLIISGETPLEQTLATAREFLDGLPSN